MTNFNPYKLVQLLLPTFLRKPIRIARLFAWLWPFILRWNEYVSWRKDMYYDAHVTSQVISIEAYLNRLFDPEHRRITISDGSFDNRVYVALRTEYYDELYIDGEDGTFVFLSDSEQKSDGFIVNIPVGLTLFAAQISGVVSKIKALGVSYQINIIN